MAKEKRDLLLHFDEEQQRIIFYTVDVANTAAIRAKEFDGVRPEVEFFREKSPDEAERVMGAMVFSSLDLFAINKIGIRDYAAQSAAAIKEYVCDLEARAAANEPEAQFFLSIEYHSRALREASRWHLDEADRLLRAAAAAGYEDARTSLERDWPLMKDAAERRLKRGPAA